MNETVIDPANAPSPDESGADWTTIWQSEAMALAVDREMQEAVQRGALLWSGYAALQARPDDASGRAGAEPPPGATPADAASDAERAGLLARIAELERRLAGS